jgi:hypothetical protein
MRRSRALVAGLALAAVAVGALVRRVAFRPRERVELRFEDGSTVLLAGSPQVDEFAAHARAALAVS